MALKTKCASCGAELEIPEDPRLGELKELLGQANRTIEGLAARLEKLGQPVPPEAKPVLKKTKRYEGIFFDDDDEAETSA